VHEKQAFTFKTRAPMIRYTSQKQRTLAEFDWPFQTALDEDNRWVKMSECMRWDELAAGYYQGLPNTQGRPMKDARLVMGAVIIKHKLCLSDRETVLQIQENPYLQYFVGLSGYQMEIPFAPSLLVEVRKRMGQEVFEDFHEAIIGAIDKAKAMNKPTPKKPSQSNQAKPSSDDDDDSTPDSRMAFAEDEAASDTDTLEERQGKLIQDATVAPQAIRYPTDLSLLNEAREFSEKIIDILYPKTPMKKKPRTYREKARKVYLGLVKQRRPAGQVRRRGIKQQLQYLRRNLKHIERLLDFWPQGTPLPLPR